MMNMNPAGLCPARQDVVVDILTDNLYLEKGLARVAAECGDSLMNVISGEACLPGTQHPDAIRICLVDIDCLSSQKNRWRDFSEIVHHADAVVIAALQDMNLHNVPYIALDRPVGWIRQALRSLLIRFKKERGTLLSSDRLTSSLSYSEKEVFLFLLCGHGVREISASLQTSTKTVYRTKSQIMKKFGVNDRRGLHRVLNLSGFLHIHAFECMGDKKSLQRQASGAHSVL